MEISIKWNVCRICLQEASKTALDPLKPLFEDADFAKQVYDITGVVIQSNDSLPDKVCPRCFKGIKSAINLRMSCRKSDKYLKTVLHRTQSATSLFRLKRKHEDLNNVLENTEESQEDWLPRVGGTGTAATTTVTSANSSPNSNERLAEAAEIDLDVDVGVEDDIVAPNRKLKKEQDQPKNDSNTLSTNPPKKQKENLPAASTNQSAVKSAFESAFGSEHGTNVFLVDTEQPQQLNINNDEDDDLDYVSYDKHSTELQRTGTEYNIDASLMSKAGNTFKQSKLRKHAGELQEEWPQETELSSTNETDTEQRSNVDMYFVLQEDDIKKEYIQHKAEAEENEDAIDATNNTLELINIDEAEFIDEEEEIEYDMQLNDRSNVTFNELEHIEYIVDDLPDTENENTSVCGGGGGIEKEEFIVDGDDEDTSSQTNDAVELKCNDNYMLQSNSSISSSSQTRKASLSNANTSSTKFHVCEVCGNGFASRSLLNYHMRTHKQPKNFECELCFKRFNAACNLTAHMRTHTGERPFECKYCHRNFSDRSTHIKHERIHTNEKPFHCHMCGKSFSLSTSLKAHERVHTGEKPYKCEPCNKSFKLPHQLKAHLGTHQHKIFAIKDESVN